jgi:protein-S-isoprenylcysteine O-methyltransferase Ste14
MNGHYSRWLALATIACIGNVVVLAIPALLLNEPSRLATDTRLIALLLEIGAWTFCESFASRNSRHPFLNEEDPTWLTPVAALVLLATLLISAIQYAMRPAIPLSVTDIAPVVLLTSGVALRLWSIHTLGPYFFSDMAHVPGQPLVVRGPYRYLRHPSEAGLFCAALGAALLYKSMAGVLVVSFVLLPLVILRTRSEDAMLARHHPNDFRRYSSRVGGLVLRLW